MSTMVGGDVITRLDGAPLATMQELASEIAQRRPGDEITLTLLRDASSRDLTLWLGERPRD
jgi:S1-C subfamily serine protease